jgi:hypothetical protein
VDPAAEVPEAEGVAAAKLDGVDAAADVAAGDEAGDEAAGDVVVGTGLDVAVEEDEAHPATPTPATTATAPTAATRLASFVEPNIVNPRLSAAQAPQQAQCHGISPCIRPLKTTSG